MKPFFVMRLWVTFIVPCIIYSWPVDGGWNSSQASSIQYAEDSSASSSQDFRRRLGPCHYDNKKKTTVCKHADGTVFVGSGGGGGSSSSSVSSSGSTGSSSGGGGGGSAPPSTVSKVPKPPLAICSDPANGERPKYKPEKWVPAPTQPFYIYEGHGFEYTPLLACYRERFKVDVWKDERMWELAQNSGALWVHETLKHHPLRTREPAEAQLFVIPVDGWLSQKAGTCNGHTHEARMHQLYGALTTQSWFKRHGGADHFIVSLWWGTTKALGEKLVSLLAHKATIIAYDEYFASDWTKVVVAPYVPHAKLTTLDLEPEASCKLGATPRVSHTSGSGSSGSGGKEEFGRSPQAPPDPKKRKEYEAKLLAEKEAKLAAKQAAKAARNKWANGGGGNSGSSSSSSSSSVGDGGTSGREYGSTMNEGGSGSENVGTETATAISESTEPASDSSSSISSHDGASESSEARRRLDYHRRRRRSNGFDLPDPITQKHHKHHHNHNNSSSSSHGSDDGGSSGYGHKTTASAAAPGDSSAAAVAPPSDFIGHGKPRAHERDISIYFRGSVMHGVMCKKRGTWPRREAYFAMRSVAGSVFVPTESPHIASMWETPGSGVPEPCKKLYKNKKDFDLRICSRAFQGRFTVGMYVDEMRRSEWCLHFRGDTTTARRFYDSIAAGCVPIIVSDGVNLPFVDRLDWRAFTVQISERDMVSGRDGVIAALTSLANNKALLLEKQRALALAAPHLVFGYGSPLDQGDKSQLPLFKSLVASHILEEVARANAAVRSGATSAPPDSSSSSSSPSSTGKSGIYRRFPVTMAGCDHKKGAEKEEAHRKKAGRAAPSSSSPESESGDAVHESEEDGSDSGSDGSASTDSTGSMTAAARKNSEEWRKAHVKKKHESE